MLVSAYFRKPDYDSPDEFLAVTFWGSACTMSGPDMLICFINLAVAAAVSAYYVRRDRGILVEDRLPEALGEVLSGVGKWRTEALSGVGQWRTESAR